jgi:hypothetical protein
MRQITSHQHKQDQFNSMFEVTAADTKNAVSGANNHYLISGGHAPLNPSFGDHERKIDSVSIFFHQGPLNKETGPCGITIESLLAICADRLSGFQTGQFPHICNELAGKHIMHAIDILHERSGRLSGIADVAEDPELQRAGLQLELDSYMTAMYNTAKEHGLSLNIPTIGSIGLETAEAYIERAKKRLAAATEAAGGIPATWPDINNPSKMDKIDETAVSLPQFYNGVAETDKPFINPTPKTYELGIKDKTVNVETTGDKKDPLGLTDPALHAAEPKPTAEELLAKSQKIVSEQEDLVKILNGAVTLNDPVAFRSFAGRLVLEEFKKHHGANADCTLVKKAIENLVTNLVPEKSNADDQLDHVAEESTEEAPVARTGTRIVGVYNEHTKKMFVDEAVLKPIEVEVAEGRTVLTSAFKFGQRLDLLGISMSPELHDLGVVDYTDVVDPGVTMETIYVQLSGIVDDAPVEEVFGFVVCGGDKEQVGASAVSSAASYGTMMIDGSFIFDLFDGIVTVDGVPSKLVNKHWTEKGWDSSKKVGLVVRVVGNVVLDTGSITLDAHTVIEKGETASDFVYEGSLLQLMNTAKPLGYEIISNRYNPNRRHR